MKVQLRIYFIVGKTTRNTTRKTAISFTRTGRESGLLPLLNSGLSNLGSPEQVLKRTEVFIGFNSF